ncbi:SH2B adapter protein 1-like [Pollicipes pollicipes]|uniref:SH2B adapter protein 1-like n=1 Tax=Pollicipes pollicipes TaxID=41117 RepID=UPI001884CE5A|nr:SH2B adapter protein 1-like [Pollicipes pollicipes]
MAMARVKNDLSDGSGWEKFCETQARSAALDFAEAFRRFVTDNSTGQNCVPFSHKDFMKKFLESFQENFEREIRKCNHLNGYAANNCSSSFSQEQLCDSHEGEVTAAKPPGRSLLQRLGSFKQLTLKKGRSVFHKQHSDEVELSPHRGRARSDKLRGKLSKIVVEIKYQGIVNFLTGDNLDVWSRCRLALVRTGAGYLLEFFTPPKALKPKSGVFCFLITEARETTALEMPDRENTFVLRAENGLEYVIEAHGARDMKTWLSVIRASMRPESTGGEPSESISLPHSLTSSDAALLERPLGSHRRPDLSHEEGGPPELPPRLAERQLEGRRSVRAAGAADVAPRPPEDGVVDAYGELHDYPWFHGTLARSDAAQLVLQEAQLGHGTFLVRQSETRVGDYVLTFNCQGRPKHLRLTISQERQCRVQHLWFNSVFTMLEHFRLHPIPLESGGSSDVTLGEFVLQAGQGKRAVDNPYSFV